MVTATALLERPARLIEGFGRYCLLLARAFNLPRDLRPKLYVRHLVSQMVEVGVASLPIVLLATAFSGGVAAQNGLYQLENPVLPMSLIGTFTQQTVFLELGPLVAAFVLTGRVGARIAAELGTMRVTEQIDALEAMGISSRSYLIVPRVAAGVLMFPLLYIGSCAVGMLSGQLVAILSGQLSSATFWEGARLYFKPYDVTYGIIKSFVFGFIITSVSCYKGYYARGGAEGVGTATTEATVVTCVFVLLADLICAVMLL